MAALVESSASLPYNYPIEEVDPGSPAAVLKGIVYSTGCHSWYCVDCGKLNKESVFQSDCGYAVCANENCQSVFTYALQFKRAPSGVRRSLVLERIRLLLRAVMLQPAD